MEDELKLLKQSIAYERGRSAAMLQVLIQQTKVLAAMQESDRPIDVKATIDGHLHNLLNEFPPLFDYEEDSLHAKRGLQDVKNLFDQLI